MLKLLVFLLQKHAFATLTSVIVPALLPYGNVLFEEGLHFIHGITRQHMLEVSPDGLIQKPGNELDKITIEIKCPYPDDNNLSVHYSISVYYTIQLLCHMAVTGTKVVWYTCLSDKSTVVLALKYDASVWEKCFQIMQELYDRENISMPKKKSTYRDEMLVMLQEYLSSNTELVAELPTKTSGDESRQGIMMGSNPYYIPCACENMKIVLKRTIWMKL